jgi:hypothetical protein
MLHLPLVKHVFASQFSSFPCPDNTKVASTPKLAPRKEPSTDHFSDEIGGCHLRHCLVEILYLNNLLISLKESVGNHSVSDSQGFQREFDNSLWSGGVGTGRGPIGPMFILFTFLLVPLILAYSYTSQYLHIKISSQKAHTTTPG